MTSPDVKILVLSAKSRLRSNPKTGNDSPSPIGWERAGERVLRALRFHPVLLASDDLMLTNWVSLGLMQSTNGIWRLLDSAVTNYPQRLYHARQLP